MLDRLDPTARALVDEARTIADVLRNDEVTAGHLLRAFFRVDGAHHALLADRDTLAGMLMFHNDDCPGCFPASAPPAGEPPLGGGLLRVIEAALAEASRAGRAAAGSEHLVLGLLAVGDVCAGGFLRQGFEVAAEPDDGSDAPPFDLDDLRAGTPGAVAAGWEPFGEAVPAGPAPRPGTGRGWADEPLPEGLRRGSAPGRYVWIAPAGLEIEMALVPAGDFEAGVDGAAWDRGGPRHRRAMPRPFWIGRYPVTRAEWRVFCAATGRKPPAWGKPDDGPANAVPWIDARAFCDWAGLRLPIESELLKAGTGDDGRLYPWGNDPPAARHAPKIDVRKGVTWSVGAFPAGVSPYGVHDLAGLLHHAAEWHDPFAFALYARGRTAPLAVGLSRLAREASGGRAGMWPDSANSLLVLRPALSPA
jgi:hypothetical protein